MFSFKYKKNTCEELEKFIKIFCKLETNCVKCNYFFKNYKDKCILRS